MNDRKLVEKLLERQESDDLDFKSKQYRLGNSKGKSQFVKDIVAMVNTPRSGAAYILVGVQEQSGRVTGTPGVDEHHDEAELGRIVAARVEPVPRFSYRQVAYEELDIGLFEVPCDQLVPVMPRNDYGVLRRRSVYVRRNTQNTEADREDLARIHQWYEGGQTSDEVPSTSSGTWQQLYRACDGFDPGRIYIAVLDGDSKADARDWTAMATVHWSIIVDSLVTRGFRVGTGEWGRLGVEGLDVPVGGCVVADEVVVVRPTPSG